MLTYARRKENIEEMSIYALVVPYTHVPSEKEAISLDNQKAQAALSTLSIEVHVYNIPLLIRTYDVHVHLLHYHDLSQDKNVIEKL